MGPKINDSFGRGPRHPTLIILGNFPNFICGLDLDLVHCGSRPIIIVNYSVFDSNC